MPTVSRTDVLIVGAGPAGLMLATQLAKLKIATRIIDKSPHPVLRGHADGLQCRTGEIFAALGIKSRFDDESHECAEVVMWNPGPSGGGIVQTDRVVDTLPGLSWARHVNLGQDRVEAIFMQAMESLNKLSVERLTAPVSLSADENVGNFASDSYPLTLKVNKLPEPEQLANGDVQNGLYRSNLFNHEESAQPETEEVEEIQCKFIVGCDGARSWVRKTLGLELKGDSANEYWGAFDAIIKSDLPTLRMKNAVHSAESGSVLMVPREEGMVRVYTQMGTLEAGTRMNRSEASLEKLIAKTKEVMKPHNLDFVYVDWWTVYEIGQRVCDTFSAHGNRVFLAGDSVHTHSPKAGQGMNVSMADTFNLGWKLAMILNGQATPDILDTYQQERHATAQQLIDFDYKWSRMFSGKADGQSVSPEAWKKAWDQSIKFTSGTGVIYKPNLLITDTQKNADKLAKSVIVGSHFENHQVVGASNAHAVQLQTCVKADGRWRIMIFPGDLQNFDCAGRLQRLGNYLGSSDSPPWRFTPASEDVDSVIQILTVFASPHRFVQDKLADIPQILLPERKPYGIRAFDTLFCDEPSYHNGDGRAYNGYGIETTTGCVIVVRPDQHVAAVYGMEEHESIGDFFESFMLAST